MVEGFLEPHAPEWTAWKTSNNLKSITVNILCFGSCYGYIISLTFDPLKSILLFWHNRHSKWAHMGSLRLSSRFDNFLPCTTYFQIRSNMAEIQIGSLYSFDRYGGSSFRKFWTEDTCIPSAVTMSAITLVNRDCWHQNEILWRLATFAQCDSNVYAHVYWCL